MGHLGNPAAFTPNLDRIVQDEAVSFRNAFCQNPVCVPSRCSFMTGWYPHVHGHRTMSHMLHTEHGETNLLQLLKENGYYVWWGGKNHLVANQSDFAWRATKNIIPTDNDYLRWEHLPRPGLHAEEDWRGEPDSDTFYSFFAGQLDTGEDDLYFDSDWANVYGALEFIRAYNGDKPFCIFLPLFFPHPPYGVEEPWFSAIDRQKLPAGANTRQLVQQTIDTAWSMGKSNLQGWSEERWMELPRHILWHVCAPGSPIRFDHGCAQGNGSL